MNTDITDRRRAESALRENEQRLRIALVAASLGTFEFDPEAGKAVWGGQMRAIWGVLPDEERSSAAGNPIEISTFTVDLPHASHSAQ